MGSLHRSVGGSSLKSWFLTGLAGPGLSPPSKYCVCPRPREDTALRAYSFLNLGKLQWSSEP